MCAKPFLKKPFKCELCEQKFKIKHFNMYNFEKKTKCILCDQIYFLNRPYVGFAGKDLKNM